MKKRIEPDITGLINKLEQQLVIIERKIDTLISKSSAARPPEAKPFPKQENNFRERTLYRAICAECRKECEVPFKPSGERPVYCKECFSKRKANSSFKPRPDNRPQAVPAVQAPHAAKPQVAEKKKPAKKKPAAKRRK